MKKGDPSGRPFSLVAIQRVKPRRDAKPWGHVIGNGLIYITDLLL